MAELASWTNMKIQNNQASLTLHPGGGQASAEMVRVLQFEWVLREPFSGFLGNSTKVSLSVHQALTTDGAYILGRPSIA